MTAKTPARGGGWSGQRPAWSREPFEVDNRAALKHGVYLQSLSDDERAEIEGIADSLRAAAPLYSASFEPTIRMAAARVCAAKRSESGDGTPSGHRWFRI